MPDNALTFRVRPLSPVVSIKSKAEEILIDLVTPSTERVIAEAGAVESAFLDPHWLKRRTTINKSSCEIDFI